MLDTLRGRLREFDVIEHILTEGIESHAAESDNVVKACSLLTSMYRLLTTCHILSDTSLQLSIVLPLWVKSCKPYLDQIDKWLYDGVLRDPFQEFIIKL